MTVPNVVSTKNSYLSLLRKIAWLGPILFHQKVFVYVTLLLALAAYFTLYKTTWGLQIRAVGEHPSAAETMAVATSRSRAPASLAIPYVKE